MQKKRFLGRIFKEAFCRKQLILICMTGLLIVGGAHASDLEILVATRDTSAHEAATELQNGTDVVVERSIHRAFLTAADFLETCGGCSIVIKIAAGTYDGKAASGHWVFPETAAPNSNLTILGSWNDDFTDRQPFVTPTILLTATARGDAVLSFVGRKTALESLVISGLVFDVSPSNIYDKRTNSMQAGSSSTHVLIRVGNIETDRLVIADNVFMNAPHRAGGPLIKAASENSRVEITNNIFFNNIIPWTVSSGVSNRMPEEYLVSGNSFILNWPLNPDPTTSNPGALEIGNNYAARQVTIERNLFAYNAGGAIFPQWDEDRGPPISIIENLFWQNGAIFDRQSNADAAIVGKFAGSPIYGTFDMFEIEDDFLWEVSNNESFDPYLGVTNPDIQTVTYGDEYRGADTERETTGVENSDSVPVTDFAAQLAALTRPNSSADTAEVSIIDEDEDYSVISPSGDILNYAPNIPFDVENLPFPGNPEAAIYGASTERIYHMGDM